MVICFGCNAPITGSAFQAHGLTYCARCYSQESLPLDATSQKCEECGRYYSTTKNWTNVRICANCDEDIRRMLGEPAYDAGLTPEERQYLRESLGLAPIDPQLDLDKPFCQSCIQHGADREGYPCLREDDCGWERKKKVAQDPGHLVGTNVQITFQTNTTNTLTQTEFLRRAVANNTYRFTLRSPGT